MGRNDKGINQDAFCPFFRGTKGRTTILCEGPIRRTWLALTLKSEPAMARYMETYCNTKGCAECRVYKCAMEKYEEPEA